MPTILMENICILEPRERYVVAYNPSKGNIYALFKDQAKPDDIFKAAFHANVLLHIIRSSNGNMSSRKHHKNDHSVLLPSSIDLEAHIAESYKTVSALFGPFKSKAKEQWDKENELTYTQEQIDEVRDKWGQLL